MTWSDTFLDVFKKNDVRFISYVLDNVLTPLIRGAETTGFFSASTFWKYSRPATLVTAPAGAAMLCARMRPSGATAAQRPIQPSGLGR